MNNNKTNVWYFQDQAPTKRKPSIGKQIEPKVSNNFKILHFFLLTNFPSIRKNIIKELTVKHFESFNNVYDLI